MTTLDASPTRAPAVEPAVGPAADPAVGPAVEPAAARPDRRRGRRRRVPTWVLRAASPVALVALWQVGSTTGTIPDRILPAPARILDGAAETVHDGSLVAALAVSSERAVLGFALGAAVGLLLGLLVGTSRLADLVVDPPLQMLRTIPFLGLIPLFIVWFGIGETPKIGMVALGVSFPLYLNASAAIRQVDPKLLETAQVLRFTPWQRISVVVVPSVLPQVLVGLRQSLGVAWLALIVAERINADAGLGYLINNADQSMRMDLVVFGLILYALLGLTTDGAVRLLERWAVRWRPAVAR